MPDYEERDVLKKFEEQDAHGQYLSELSVKTLLKAFKEKRRNGDYDFDDDEFDDDYVDDYDDDYDYKMPQETVRREEPKIGRNDPCPCGSGKKYKKCHGN